MGVKLDDDGNPVSVNDYVIERMLGQGGFGTTYLARRGEDHYALKATEKEMAKNEYAVMKRLRGLCHHHVLCPIELIRSPQTYYLVSEYVEGTDLGTYATRGASALVTTTFVHQLILQMLDALSALHLIGVAHCDVKPPNIMVSPRRTHFTLIDFGVSTTHARRVLGGTALYISPQLYELRAENKLIKMVDLQACDLFALAVSFYEVLHSGRYPFRVTDRSISTNTPVSDSGTGPVVQPYALEDVRFISSPKATPWMEELFVLLTVLNHRELNAIELYHAVRSRAYGKITEMLLEWPEQPY